MFNNLQKRVCYEALKVMLVTLLACIALLPQLGFSERLLKSEANTITVFKAAGPYVVHVRQLKHKGFFGLGKSGANTGNGSGFLWGAEGFIVTNHHVVEGAKQFAVRLSNGKVYKASLVGSDLRNDIAVLRLERRARKIKAIPKTSIPWTKESDLQVGQKAIAIGNPFGLSQTLTDGVVSALDRDLPGKNGTDILDMIQTDASINPGNSGGPLLDSSGALIGMNTMIFSPTGSYTGVGFAIPADTIARVVKQIIRYGYVKVPGIGITAVDDGIVQMNNIQGVVIMQVLPNTPAADAGLRGVSRLGDNRYRVGDVIKAINGQTVKDYNTFYRMLSQTPIGDEVHLKIRRSGKNYTEKMQVIDLSEHH